MPQIESRNFRTSIRFWITGWSWYFDERSMSRLAGTMCSGTAWYHLMTSGCFMKKLTYFLAPSTFVFSSTWKPWIDR